MLRWSIGHRRCCPRPAGFRVPGPVSYLKVELRNGKAKGRALSRNRFDPDASAVAFDDFLAYGQTYTSSRVLFASMKALEDHENAFKVLRLNSDAIILDRKDPFAPGKIRFGIKHRTRLQFG